MLKAGKKEEKQHLSIDRMANDSATPDMLEWREERLLITVNDFFRCGRHSQ